MKHMEITVDGQKMLGEILPTATLDVGDLCIAWDFEPMPDREDRFVIGRVEDVDYENGTYLIAVDYDSTDMEREEVRTPFRLLITEWDGRLKKLD